MPSLSAVHPLQPRFAQAITAVLCLAGIALGSAVPVALALALVALSLAGPRVSPVAWAFRRIAPPPTDLEPAAPVRFSQALAAVALALALALIASGASTAGWVVAGGVAALATISAATGVCVGCEAYRLALAVRRRGADDLRGDLGLSGPGPWVVVLTAPGCARCEPLAREMERAAGAREVVRVSLAEHPRAAALPVRSVPAALAVASDGALVTARAGRIGPPEIAQVLAAV